MLVTTDPWMNPVRRFEGNALAAVVLGSLVFAAVELRARSGPRPAARRGQSGMARPRPRLALAATLAIVGFDLVQYLDWIPRRAYALEEAKASFAQVVGDDAILAGSFAPALVLGTRRVAVPLYGTARPGMFEEYGVTHLVIGEPGSTKEIEAASPGILERLDTVRRWPIRTRHLHDLGVYRIRDAEAVVSGRYVPTTFERAVDRIIADDCEGALVLLGEFRASRPVPVPDAFVLDAECLLTLGREDEARALLEEAVQLRPQSPLELYNLGVLLERAGESDRARSLWKRGFAADPIDENLARALRETMP
jgi:tetratricopeptide (TPR) repeat protein